MRRTVVAALLGVVLAAPQALSGERVSWHRDVTGTTPTGVQRSDLAVATNKGGRTAVAGTEEATDGRSRFFVRVYGRSGRLRWSAAWQPLADSFTYGTAVDVANDGRVYAGGLVERYRHPSSTGWFLRAYGPRGALLWSRASPGWRQGLANGGTSGVAVRPRGVAVSTWTCGESGCFGGWVRAYALDGELRWSRAVGGRFGRTQALDVGNAGGSFVGGASGVPDDPLGLERAFVARVTPDGSALWSRTLAGLGRSAVTDVVAVRGRLLVVGGVGGEGRWLAALRLDGSRRWLKTWSGGPSVAGAAIRPDATIVVAGSERMADGSKALVLRTYRPSGALVATDRIDPATVNARGLAIDADHLGSSMVGAYDGVGRLWRLQP